MKNLLTEKQETRIFSVTELSELIKARLEPEFSGVWVTGEISNFKIYSSGHAYFSLKDENSQLRAVSFYIAGQKLKFTVEDGLKVIVYGRLSVYVKRGEYNIIVERIEPAGKGALQLAFEQLKERLAKEGLFDESRKTPIPVFPERIGIITSLDGAALKDILSILEAGEVDAQILIYPVQVQGESAKREIAGAIEWLNAHEDRLDVLLVGRGGGSLEDLWAFNEEIVARAIVSSRIPVISCVGHETDYTIADFAADLRMPTPSAAAEYIVKNRRALSDHLVQLQKRFSSNLNYTLSNLAQRMKSAMSSPVFLKPVMLVEQKMRLVDELSENLNGSIGHILEIKSRDFKILAEKANMLSPLNVLSRGYSISWKLPGNTVVKDAGVLAAQDLVRTRVNSGEFISRVTEVLKNEKERIEI
jgi:exodeoxyribonuclease VII large subunit